MEVCGSFKTITGGICGSESRDRKKDIQVVPLSACSKDIENHLSSYSFTGPVNEVELILCRAAIFKMPGNLESAIVESWGLDGQEELQDAEYPLIYPTTEKAAIKPGQKETED